MYDILPFAAGHRTEWDILAREYQAFYGKTFPDSQYDHTWHRLMEGSRIHGVAARVDGAIVGIAHYLFHQNVWSDDVCYLQDLFVDEAARGRGIARALVEHVAAVARQRGAPRLYWQTKEDNARARALYDRIATFNGFIRYEYPLARGSGN